ncbi:hypothetical protein TW81_17870 [Vibrio galatheae]|uniref:Uncharacterized protein n=1 Tax=Vibrio galatheae TaxID=579748 RepID=A0A0F4NHP4_9VIBR|nr:hypothetical protein [Vibrio galatheae]KJY81576.1 hypothetical protein TW81_17870 [Vibrio galatheae]
MKLLSCLLIALANTTVVIDINGNVRNLLPGETPGPGEIIVVVGQGATAISDFDIQLFESGSVTKKVELGDDISSAHELLEQGVDLTRDSDYATAAGDGEESTSELINQGLTEDQSDSLLYFISDYLMESQSEVDENLE